MEMIKVKSSLIAAVGYENSSLVIHLNTGKKYKYFRVPETVFERFLKAPSKGVFFNQSVKPFYDYVPLN